MGRLSLFRLFHQAMLLETSGIGQETIAPFLLPAIRHEDYQLVPVKMALSLPRPRLLIADDVGLGKTIEAGLILCELHARRRANRVLIVCPASLCLQWQREMQVKFGFRFVIFNRQTLAQKRRELEAGTNPWAYEPRIITSMDFLKRPDGAFREIQGLRWDVIIVDEAHHLAPSGAAESDKQLTRLGRFLAEASDALLLLTATPHNGYDESMATLLSFLDPSLVSDGKKLIPNRYRRHYIRRLKKHIRNPDGSPKFVERMPVQPLQVTLSPEEKKLHEQVRAYAERILALAEKAEPADRQAIQFVATVLCKRAVSSRKALLETLKRRLERLQESRRM
jgi:SNF2 family DNA or RNA helicase